MHQEQRRSTECWWTYLLMHIKVLRCFLWTKTCPHIQILNIFEMLPAISLRSGNVWSRCRRCSWRSQMTMRVIWHELLWCHDRSDQAIWQVCMCLMHHLLGGRLRMCLLQWRRQVCQPPKRDILKRLLKPTTTCLGKPVLHVSEEDGKLRGAGAHGTFIVCRMETNWYCIKCRNWCCNRSPPNGGVEYFRDVNMHHARKGTNHHITGKFTCLMSCHPCFLCADLNDDERENPFGYWVTFHT